MTTFHPPTASAHEETLRKRLSYCSPALLEIIGRRLLRSSFRPKKGNVIDQLAAGLTNPVILDRQLQALSSEAGRILSLLKPSCQTVWTRSSLLELTFCLQTQPDPTPLMELCETGFLLPETPPPRGGFWKSLEEVTFGAYLLQPETVARLDLFQRQGQVGVSSGNFLSTSRLAVVPSVMQRISLEFQFRLDEGSWFTDEELSSNEADGLEWLLRLGALWQKVVDAPLRLTNQGQFFKKDWDRISSAPLAAPASSHVLIPDLGAGLVSLGRAIGLFELTDTSIQARSWPSFEEADLVSVLTCLWSAYFNCHSWNALEGWHQSPAAAGLPASSLTLITFALLLGMPSDAWTTPDALARWLLSRHLFFKQNVGPASSSAIENIDGQVELAEGPAASLEESSPHRHNTPERRQLLHRLTTALETLLAGWTYELRLTQIATASDGSLAVRLSPTGRAILSREPVPPAEEFPKTLFVQPNLEIVAYRQGLTPLLIADLSRFANWVTLGPACTLRLEPASVYRGLENGCPVERIEAIFNRHGTKEIPPSVSQALRTWAEKHERLTVVSEGILVEFVDPQDLEKALTRGLPGVPLSDRFLLVEKEADLQWQHFRIVANRDYRLPPERCVAVGTDGVTLVVDRAKADLLIDVEIERFAEPNADRSTATTSVYQITIASLARAAEFGFLDDQWLEEWFRVRCGRLPPPTVHLLRQNRSKAPLRMTRLVVLETPSEVIADALCQWPTTRGLIEKRIGPTAIAVAPAQCDELARILWQLNWEIDDNSPK